MGHHAKYQKRLEKASRLASLGEFSKAIPHYEALVKIFPDQIELWLQLAHMLGLSGQRDEAHAIFDRLQKIQPDSSELHIRIAHYFEEWQEYEAARGCWEHLANNIKLDEKQKQSSDLHRVRMLERVNRITDAQSLLDQCQIDDADAWGWHWISGRLAQRHNDPASAIAAYEKAYDSAHGSFLEKCASAVARAADLCGNYELAYEWLKKTIDHRANEVKNMKQIFPLKTEIPSLPESVMDSRKSHRPLVFLTGMPRAGTTLLAHKLAEYCQLHLSEEYDYLKHLIDAVAFGVRKLSPEQLARKPGLKRMITNYWQAQKQSGNLSNDIKDAPLLDKNPSFAMLTPWLLALFPETKIIWLERDPRDAWISSVALDVPVNGVTCWWQTAQDYEVWCQQQAQLRDRLEKGLPEEQFIRLTYEELVTDLDGVIDMIAKRFSLNPSGQSRQHEKIVTSPSYAEVTKSITTNRIARWENYRPFLQGAELEAFDRLPASYGYREA